MYRKPPFMWKNTEIGLHVWKDPLASQNIDMYFIVTIYINVYKNWNNSTIRVTACWRDYNFTILFFMLLLVLFILSFQRKKKKNLKKFGRKCTNILKLDNI